MERNTHYVERAVETYEALTGLRVCVHDLHDVLSAYLKPSRLLHSSPTCQVVKNSAYHHQCIDFENHHLRPVAGEMPQGRIHQCHAGLVELVVPVHQDGALILVLFAGQRLAGPDLKLDYQAPSSLMQYQPNLPLISRQEADLALEALRQLGARLRSLVQEFDEAGVEMNRREQIRWFISQHHAKPIKLKDLAGYLHLSEGRCAHLVKELLGKSWQELLKEARLRRAVQLLSDTPLSISEVAIESGYNDEALFFRHFKAHFNTTPRRFRIAIT